MIHRIAQTVQNGLEQGLGYDFVGLRRIALDDQTDLLVQAGSHFTHQTRETLENLAERQDPCGQHLTQQVRGLAIELRVEFLQALGQRIACGGLQSVAEGVFGDRELAGQFHERIDPIDIEPRGAGGWAERFGWRWFFS